jgi:hypothetical protein
MKRILVILITISTLSLVSCGPSKPLTPEEQVELDKKIQFYTDLLEQRSFVVEANTVFSKRGRSFQMNPSINFVKLENGEGVLQLAFNQIVGWNGVGGITLDGKVRNYKINKGDGSKMPSVQFDMNGTLGWATVRIVLNTSGIARASVDAGMSGGRVTFAGPLVPLSESSVYEGHSL